MLKTGLLSGLAALLVGGAWLIRGPAPLPGTDLGMRPAPAFELVDYRGVGHRLADFRGKPVVLSFLFANCPDVCRLTAAGLRATAHALGPAAGDVAWLGLSVDPAGDTPAAVRQFLGRQDLADQLVYLNGPALELQATWKAYFAAGGDVHSDLVYLIDKQGRQRALLHSDFDPDELTRALRTLLAENG